MNDRDRVRLLETLPEPKAGARDSVARTGSGMTRTRQAERRPSAVVSSDGSEPKVVRERTLAYRFAGRRHVHLCGYCTAELECHPGCRNRDLLLVANRDYAWDLCGACKVGELQ